MKKIVGSLLMTSTLLLAGVAPIVANAESVQTASTDTTAAFTEGDQVTTPVDPTDPDQPGTPGEGTNTVDPIPAGKLALIYAPKTLDFGSNKVDAMSAQSYSATGSTTSLFGSNVVLEVSDVRGTTAGWNLTASASALTNTGDKSATVKGDVLKGATIGFTNGAVTASGDSKTNGATASDVTLATDGTAQTLLNATSGNGAGVTVDQYTPADVNLNVAANTAKVGTYTGTVTWNLSDTPAS